VLFGAAVRFLITARDISGRITLRRGTLAAAMKRASELAEDGFVEIEITGPDGRQYPPQAFDQLPRDGAASLSSDDLPA
jgi:hypothetical protein